MTPEQLLGPRNLPGTQVFYVYEAVKIVMILKNEDFVFTTLQVVLPDLESFDNSQ